MRFITLSLCLVLFLLVPCVFADKLDDLSLTVSQKSSELENSRIMLLSNYGLVSVARPELNLPKKTDLESTVIDIVNLVIAGPNEEEKSKGIKSVFPEGTILNKVAIEKKESGDFVDIFIDFPEEYISNPSNIEGNFDWFSGSIIKSLQNLPINSFKILAHDPKSKTYLPLDNFLPFDNYGGPDKTPDLSSPSGTVKSEKNQYPAIGNGRPTGALSGKAVYLNPGHGYYWHETLSWTVQRGFVQNNVEDFSNVDLINQYLAAYCYNAGADVFSVRELDFNTNMVIADNDDGSPNYVESGSDWFDSSLDGFANGHIPYISGEDPFSYGTNRLVECVVGTPTNWATWTPDIPESGWYHVYVSHGAYSNRSPQAHYRIFHAGGETDYYLDQRMRRFTWIHIGTYYFEAGGTNKVVLYNDSTSTSHYISADAVRFGGGMGLISRGSSGTSGKPRRDEEARYHIQFSGSPYYDGSSHDMSDGWTYRPRFGRWLKEGAEAYGASEQDSVFISSHTNAFDSSVSGLGTFVYTGYDGTWHDTFRNYVHDEVKNDLYNGYSTDFDNHGSGKKYGTYGENNPNNVGDIMPIFLGEWLFHDNASDMNMYHDPKFRQMMARAICQGIVKFWANRNGTSVNLLPEPPRNFKCVQQSTTSVQLNWDAPVYGGTIVGDAATGYKVYQSTHGRGFPPATAVTGTSTTIESLIPGTTYYFYITATNAGGESFPTEVLAVKLAVEDTTPKLLVVNGFDKLDKSTRLQVSYSGGTLYRQIYHRMNTFDYIVEHGKAIDNYSSPVAFDSCEDEVLGDFNLSDYAGVIWIGGIQAEVDTGDTTVDTSFTSSQQAQIAAYLSGGGKMFVSGAEIAWELDRSGGTTWVDTTLKANYVSDDADSFTVTGSSGSIFSGLGVLGFDDGTGPAYKVNWPDVIEPLGSAVSAFEYGGSTGSGIAIDNFEDSGGWKDPNYSSQTNASGDSTFGITTSPVYEGSNSGDLYYVWDTGDFIREYNSSLPEFPAYATFSIWIYGDGSGHQVRICLRDSDDSDLFVNDYTTLDFTGWREIVWTDIKNNPGNVWVASGDGVVTGSNIKFDSIQVNKVTSVDSGHIYFDNATYSIAETGSGTGSVAAIQYDGDYKLVYMGFPFETITEESIRNDVMKRVLDFFDLSSSQTSVNFWKLF